MISLYLEKDKDEDYTHVTFTIPSQGCLNLTLDFVGVKELSLNLEQIWKDLSAYITEFEAYQETTPSCQHKWMVELVSIESPIVYCGKCKRQKPNLPIRLFQKLMDETE